MNLTTPIALDFILKLAAAAGALTILAYILKMRRRRFEVPFSTLWQRVLREKETTTLWKHLRRILSLLLWLSILALLVFAILGPELGGQDEDAKNVVIIIDASASMKAVDEGEDGTFARIDEARRKAHELIRSMGEGDAAMLMRMDGQTTPLTRFVSDKPKLHKVVDSIAASDTPADLERALGAASDALRERQNPLVVIIGDGAYAPAVTGRITVDDKTGEPAKERPDEANRAGPDERDSTEPPKPDKAPDKGNQNKATADDERLANVDLSGIDVRYIPIGKKADNVGIVAFNARRYLADKSNYSVFIEVQNFGDTTVTRKLTVYSGDNPIDVKTVTLPAGERRREIYPKLSGGVGNRLRAELSPAEQSSADDHPDVFALDDSAYALLPARKRQKVLLVTLDNLYLEGAMLVYDNIQVDKITPEEYDQAIAAGLPEEYNAVVFDEHTPEKLPPSSTHLVYFHPGGEHSPFPIKETVPDPRVTETAENHPVMRWIILSDAHFDETHIFKLDRSRGDVSLASFVRDPLIAATRDGPRKIVAFGFPLAGTDLTLRVAFPLLLVNTLDWVAGDDADLLTTYATGRRFRVPIDVDYGTPEVDVVDPLGKKVRAPVNEGLATFYGNRVGIHQLTARDGSAVITEIELAANLANPNESDITPEPELTLGDRTLNPPGEFSATPSRSLWTYLVLFVLFILCIEWITYNRRITV